MDGVVREFVAVEVGRAKEQTGTAPAHLTLRFLGEVAPGQNPVIATALAEVAHTVPGFVIRLEGVGAFPDPARPRVVWVGVTAGRTELVELARRVRVALDPIFGPDREEFVPHLTMFRVRSPTDRAAARELLSGVRASPSAREVRVDELVLKESVLGPHGAVHRTVAAFPLQRSLRPSG